MASNTLSLRENNLYINGRVIVFSDGEQLLLRDKVVAPETAGDQSYIVKLSDRLDKLTHTFYSPFTENASKLWWVLADVNDIVNPLDISELVNTEIRIPDIQTLKLRI